jgi:hypothetical protein
MGWYGTGRFIEDFFRIDDTVALGLSGSQLTAAALAITAYACLVTGRVPTRSPASDGGAEKPKRVGRLNRPS